MAIEYFPCYLSYRSKLQKLDEAAVGRLFLALMDYAESGQMPELSGAEAIAFDFISYDIDKARNSYQERCETNRENGKKGGRPKNRVVISENPKNQTVISETEKSQTKDEAKNKIKNTPHTPQGGFERFWSAYPKKVGKQAAKKAFDKANVPVETLLTAIERQKCSTQWSKDNGQYIPNPTTWLNQGRWEDEIGTPEVPPPAWEQPLGRMLRPEDVPEGGTF